MSFKNLYMCLNCEFLNSFRSIDPTEKDSTFYTSCVSCGKISSMPHIKSIEKN